MLGVACGSLGALTAVPAHNIAIGLDRVLAGDWSARSLPALHIDDASHPGLYALNDFVFIRGGGGS